MKSISVEIENITQMVRDRNDVLVDRIDLDVAVGDEEMRLLAISVLKKHNWPPGFYDDMALFYRFNKKTLYCSVDHYEVAGRRFNTLEVALKYADEKADCIPGIQVYAVAVFKQPVSKESL